MPKKFSILLFLFFTIRIFSQNNSIAEIDKTIQQIKSHLESFERIEKLNSPEGNKYAYFNEGELQLISVNETGKVEKTVQWFYHDKILIYTETNWLSAEGKLLYSEKTYHYNGSLIAWLNSENTFVDSSSPEFIKLDKKLTAYGIKIREEALKEDH